jgi:hypothetical protein
VHGEGVRHHQRAREGFSFAHDRQTTVLPRHLATIRDEVWLLFMIPNKCGLHTVETHVCCAEDGISRPRCSPRLRNDAKYTAFRISAQSDEHPSLALPAEAILGHKRDHLSVRGRCPQQITERAANIAQTCPGIDGRSIEGECARHPLGRRRVVYAWECAATTASARAVPARHGSGPIAQPRRLEQAAVGSARSV